MKTLPEQAVPVGACLEHVLVVPDRVARHRDAGAAVDVDRAAVVAVVLARRAVAVDRVAAGDERADGVQEREPRCAPVVVRCGVVDHHPGVVGDVVALDQDTRARAVDADAHVVAGDRVADDRDVRRAVDIDPVGVVAADPAVRDREVGRVVEHVDSGVLRARRARHREPRQVDVVLARDDDRAATGGRTHLHCARGRRTKRDRCAGPARSRHREARVGAGGDHRRCAGRGRSRGLRERSPRVRGAAVRAVGAVRRDVVLRPGRAGRRGRPRRPRRSSRPVRPVARSALWSSPRRLS